MNMMTAKTDAVVPTEADAGLAEEAAAHDLARLGLTSDG